MTKKEREEILFCLNLFKAAFDDLCNSYDSLFHNWLNGVKLQDGNFLRVYSFMRDCHDLLEDLFIIGGKEE